MDWGLLLALVSGVAIAAACGLRAFLPLFVVGLAARNGFLSLGSGSQWLTSDQALWALGVATVLEIAGDKIPIVDHALDAIGTVLRPAAAWVGGFALLHGWGEPWAGLLSLVLGVGAFAVNAAKAKARLGSTAVTLGHANPALSVAEDATSLGLLAAAILAPLAALVLVVLLVWLVQRAFRPRLTARTEPPAA